eukprot:15262658-Ditylum_brightwellii.AAC.1
MENIIEMEMDDPIAFVTKHDPGTMYFHQAVKQPDAPQSVEVIVKEINGHIERGHGNQHFGCCVGHEAEKGNQDKTDNQ